MMDNTDLEHTTRLHLQEPSTEDTLLPNHTVQQPPLVTTHQADEGSRSTMTDNTGLGHTALDLRTMDFLKVFRRPLLVLTSTTTQPLPDPLLLPQYIVVKGGRNSTRAEDHRLALLPSVDPPSEDQMQAQFTMHLLVMEAVDSLLTTLSIPLVLGLTVGNLTWGTMVIFPLTSLLGHLKNLHPVEGKQVFHNHSESVNSLGLDLALLDQEHPSQEPEDNTKGPDLDAVIQCAISTKQAQIRHDFIQIF